MLQKEVLSRSRGLIKPILPVRWYSTQSKAAFFDFKQFNLKNFTGFAANPRAETQLTPNEKNTFPEPDFDSLMQFISKNQTIKNFLLGLSINDQMIQTLMKAIQQGDETASIFTHPTCHLYLLYLIKNKTIPFWQGMSVYHFVTAKQHYQDAMQVEKIVALNSKTHTLQLTGVGEDYVHQVGENFKELKLPFHQQTFINFILSLPASEQWLLNIPNHPNNKNYRFVGALCVNIPFIITTKPQSFCENETDLKNINFNFYTPSTSIINFLLKQISPAPLHMYPTFGSVNEKTLLKLHADNKHPVALHSNLVKSGLTKAHGSVCPEFILSVHDWGHAFWGTYLGKAGRDFVFKEFIPALQSLQLEAKAVGDYDVLRMLEEIITKVHDFDLTPIKKFYYAKDRLETYLNHCLTDDQQLFFPNVLRVDDKIGRTAEDRLYYLLFKKYYEQIAQPHTDKERWNKIMSFNDGPHFKDQAIINALIMLAYTSSKTGVAINQDVKQDPKIDWIQWLGLLNTTKDGNKIWNFALRYRKEELLHLISFYGVEFFPPYLPLTEEKHQALKTLVQDKWMQEKRPGARI
ncbi:MAG: hypothetical protein H0W64_06190 [Gammaproteobacteria bacterium]|nr:hypothetical protein [Gammaproteobacteria bacterium]